MSEVIQRRQLGAFLRSRRERLTPAEVGLIAGARRRTPGLRREEAALLSGVSVTWYTWLEQARDITVSDQVLDSIARALRMNPAERRHLFGLAGKPLPATGPTQPINPVLQRLVDTFEPHPAYLTNACGDFLGWNRAHAAIFGDPADLPDTERNIMWLVFTSRSLRTQVVDWQSLAMFMITQYRAEVGLHSHADQFDTLTAALRDASADFRDWWDNNATAEFRPPHWEIDHPHLGRLAFDYVKFVTNAEPDVKMVTAVPADPETARKLATGRLPRSVRGATSLPN